MLDTVKRISKSSVAWYAAGIAVMFGLKWFYSRADADQLNWILEPTARLAGFLSGVSFSREARSGWITISHRMIIAPACAGLNFMIISFATAFFPFVTSHSGHLANGLLLLKSLGWSLLLTVATNAIRIVAALRLYEMDIYSGWVTPDRVHRVMGVLLYCFFLLAFHFVRTRQVSVHHAWTPFTWYAVVALGIPLVGRIHSPKSDPFYEHALFVLSVCGGILLLLCILELGAGWARDLFRGPLKK